MLAGTEARASNVLINLDTNMINRTLLLTLFIALAACGSEEPIAPIQPGTPSAGAGAAGAAAGAAGATGGAALPPTGGGGAPIGAGGAGGVAGNTITIGPGFAPDPITFDGTGGGLIPANTWTNNQCRGYTTAMNAPMILVNVTGTIPMAHFLAGSANDSTLIIQKPDGSYICDDDAGGEMNPRVSAMLTPGQYKVWVGAYSRGQLQYRFGISVTTTTPSALGGPASGAGAGGGGVGAVPSMPTQPLAIAPGFMPDPATVNSMVNATIDASTMGSQCFGYVDSSPTVTLTAQGAFAYLRIMAASNDRDTVIVIRGPGGQVWCNDDFGGELNSGHEGPIGPGVYQIHAGFLSPHSGAIVVGASELSHVAPSQMLR